MLKGITNNHIDIKVVLLDGNIEYDEFYNINIDFFKNDDPKSIAQKITTVNLSDLSSMGAKPYCYTLMKKTF